MKVFRLFLFGFLLSLAFFCFTGQKTTYASNDWLGANDIKFSEQTSSDSVVLPKTRFGSNVKCNDQLLILRPEKRIVGFTYQPEITYTDCMTLTGYGAVGANVFLKNGADVAGPISLESHKQFIVPGPKSSHAIVADTTAPTGIYINLLKDIGPKIITTVENDNRVSYSLLPGTHTTQLKNSLNQRLVAHYHAMNFSNDGRWMIFDSPYYGLVRVDTMTGEVLSFGSPTNYRNGRDPRYSLAISVDGRHAVVGASGYLVVYDLESCQDQTGSLSYLKNCQKTDLEPKRLQQTGFGIRSMHIEFVGDSAFTYYSSERINNLPVLKKYIVSIGEYSQFNMQYLGLGDSFSSGEGAFDYKVFTDNEDNKCHLSLDSYPYLLSRAIGYENYESVACSGAKTRDIDSDITKYSGQFYNQQEQAQRSDTDLLLRSFKPGDITQSTFVGILNPEAITLSIGGNDVAFGEKIKACVMRVPVSSACFDTYEERKAILNELADLVPTLTSVYNELKQNGRRVYALGYPKIVDPQGECAVNVHLNQEERFFADKLTVLLNDAIETATMRAGVFYVDVEDIFEGRRLCEIQSEYTLVHGLTGGDDVGALGIKFIGRESYHPKKSAHAEYKNALIIQTNNMTAPMPEAKPLTEYRKLEDNDDFLQLVDRTGLSVYYPKYQDIIGDRVSAGDEIQILLDNYQTNLGALQLLNAEIHSDPVDLGQFATDANGSLSMNFVVPDDIEPGYHSIHIYGKSTDGKDLDIYDYVLIGRYDDDFDGDGVLDSDEGCVYVSTTGFDDDKDGIDNACDGVFNELVVGENSDSTENDLGNNPAQLNDNDLNITPAYSFGSGIDSPIYTNDNQQNLVDQLAASSQKPAFASSQKTNSRVISDSTQASKEEKNDEKNQSNINLYLLAGAVISILGSLVGIRYFYSKN